MARKAAESKLCARWILVGMLLFALSHITGAQEELTQTALAPEQIRLVYGTEADAVDADQAAGLLAELINEERAAAGLHELQPRPLAAVLAQAQAEEMARERYAGHYSMAGLKCERRYNLLGQTDHVSENTAYYEIQYPVYLTPQLVRRVFQHWWESEDHRRNMLDSGHTHLGSGFSLIRDGDTSYVAAVTEFINEYGDYDRLPLWAQPGTRLEVGGHLDPRVATLKYIGLGREDLPFSREAEYSRDLEEQVAFTGGYSPPAVASAYLPVQYMGRYRPDVRQAHYSATYDETSGEFDADVPLPSQPDTGAYYLTVWAGSPEPQLGTLCAMTQVVLVGDSETGAEAREGNSAEQDPR